MTVRTSATVGWLAGVTGFSMLLAIGPASGQDKGFINDYPTSARADYVFGCMAVNGQTRDALERCSCSSSRGCAQVPYSLFPRNFLRSVWNESTGRFDVT